MAKTPRCGGRRIAAILALAVVLSGSASGADEKPATAVSPLATEGPEPNPIAPTTREAIEASIRRGVDFLLARQNENGSFGSAFPARPVNVMAPVPGAHHAFRAAVTSLCISALIETGDDRPEVAKAIDHAEAWMFEHLPEVRRSTPAVMYNTWAHSYAIRALVHMLHRRPDDRERCEKIRGLIRQQIQMLERYECVDGGWCYYDFNARTQKPSGSTISFVSATALVALSEAKAAGVEVPQRIVDRATASIRRQRKPDFSYLYGEYLKNYPMFSVNRPGGSLGRSQVCNLAMRLWGDPTVTDEVMETWLDRLFARNLWLDIGRKRPIPHESWFKVAGYFFYYGHYYASLVIEQVPEDKRREYRDRLAFVLVRLQEKDGSWWDFPLYDYHQQYGTAFAIMSLVRCRGSEKR